MLGDIIKVALDGKRRLGSSASCVEMGWWHKVVD